MFLKILAILTKISEIIYVKDKHTSLCLKRPFQNALKFVHKSFDKAVRHILHTFQDVLFLNYSYRCNYFPWKTVGFLAMIFPLS